MSDIIADYQKWKQQGEDLRAQAKHAMEARFRELLGEAVAISEEYRADFGGALKPPAPVTAFRYKASAQKSKKAAKGKAKAAAATAAASTPAVKAPTMTKTEAPGMKANPKVAGLQKRLAAARKKLEDAKTAGTPTRVLEDRVYEIEDELRLAGQA
jgi:hypothetical protein